MKRRSIQKEAVRRKVYTGKRSTKQARERGKKIAISLVGTWLGDRLILEAALRLHRKNFPRDQLIAILDRHDGVDFPYTVRRHFDDIWWIVDRLEKKWNASPRSTLARKVRDLLITERVSEVYTPWQPGQLPRNASYRLRPHSCFREGNYLRRLRFYPRVVVPRREKEWAKEYLASAINGQYDGLISVHIRNIPRFPEKNPDPRLIGQIIDWLRTQGRFAFCLLGRDDAPSSIAGPDVFSFIGEHWPFDRTSAVIQRSLFFIGADSSLTHAAAGLGRPMAVLGYTANLAIPFAPSSRYVLFRKGESIQTIMAGVRRLVEGLNLADVRRRRHG